MIIYSNFGLFPLAGATVYHTKSYTSGRLTRFNCNGSETNLTDCQFTDLQHNYDYGDYAGIKCCE